MIRFPDQLEGMEAYVSCVCLTSEPPWFTKEVAQDFAVDCWHLPKVAAKNGARADMQRVELAPSEESHATAEHIQRHRMGADCRLLSCGEGRVVCARVGHNCDWIRRKDRRRRRCVRADGPDVEEHRECAEEGGCERER